MQNHLSQKFILTSKAKKTNSTWKLALVLFGLSSLMPTVSLPIGSKSMQPLVSGQVLAQTEPPANTTQEDILVKVGALSREATDRTIAKWQPTMDYLSQTIPGYTFERDVCRI